MLNFNYYSPTYFMFGRDTQHQCGELVRRFGGNKVLIHYGGGSVIRSGLLDQVKVSLEKEGLSYVELGGVVPNPRDTLVYEGIELCRRENVDFLLAVGGGSVIDSVKAIAVGVPYEGDFWDFHAYRCVPTRSLKKGCVVTIPAAGSEGSLSCVITKTEGLLKRGVNVDANRMDFSIINPELVYTLPRYQIACGVADMMSHIMERYFTNTLNVDVSDRLCEGALTSIIQNAPIAYQNPTDYESHASLCWSAAMAHNGCYGVGREEDWACHAMEHELSALHDVAHGAGLAVITPAWLRYVLPGHEMRLAQFAVRVFGCEMDFESPARTALEGIRRLEAFFRSLDLPLTLKELGVPKESIATVTAKAKCGPDGCVGHFAKLSKADVEAIFRSCAE